MHAGVVHCAPKWHTSGVPELWGGALAAGKNTVRTSVILPEDAHARVQALASANGVSAAWIIRTAVMRFLDQQGEQIELPLRLPKAGRGEPKE